MLTELEMAQIVTGSIEVVAEIRTFLVAPHDKDPAFSKLKDFLTKYDDLSGKLKASGLKGSESVAESLPSNAFFWGIHFYEASVKAQNKQAAVNGMLRVFRVLGREYTDLVKKGGSSATIAARMLSQAKEKAAEDAQKIALHTKKIESLQSKLDKIKETTEYSFAVTVRQQGDMRMVEHAANLASDLATTADFWGECLRDLLRIVRLEIDAQQRDYDEKLEAIEDAKEESEDAKAEHTEGEAPASNSNNNHAKPQPRTSYLHSAKPALINNNSDDKKLARQKEVIAELQEQLFDLAEEKDVMPIIAKIYAIHKGVKEKISSNFKIAPFHLAAYEDIKIVYNRIIARRKEAAAAARALAEKMGVSTEVIAKQFPTDETFDKMLQAKPEFPSTMQIQQWLVYASDYEKNPLPGFAISDASNGTADKIKNKLTRLINLTQIEDGEPRVNRLFFSHDRCNQYNEKCSNGKKVTNKK